VYTVDTDGQVLKAMSLWTVKNQKAYVVSYTAKESTYNDFKKDAEDIIASFEFL